MPEVQVEIGGRIFDVACQEGEEHFLKSAAKMLDEEATHLGNQIGRLPEPRMLLMAGLMLADKTAGLQDKLRIAEGRIEDKANTEPEPVEVKVEVPVVPETVQTTLAGLAARAEALADQLDRM